MYVYTPAGKREATPEEAAQLAPKEDKLAKLIKYAEGQGWI